MALTDLQLRKAAPQQKPYKLADSHGLHVLVSPNGSKLFRFKYRFAGKEKLLSLGKYPLLSLAEARSAHVEARRLHGQGIDPGYVRKQNKLQLVDRHQNSLRAVAIEWRAKNSPGWSSEHDERVWSRLERHVFPFLGDVPIAEITSQALLEVLRRIERHGARDTTHRACQTCGQIFRYAIATGRCSVDPTYALRGSLAAVKSKHFATITNREEVGQLLRDIDNYKGHFVTVQALKLAPLTFVRPVELRKAEWSEFDFEAGLWKIPGARMKARVIHIVPLSTQSLHVLQELQKVTGRGRYLFPGLRTRDRPMSANAILSALRRMDYAKEQMTGHGFRAMASTLINESGRFDADWIERQLAHSEKNKVRKAYNHAAYLPQRKVMMQWWADELDKLRLLKRPRFTKLQNAA